jgi:antagonist of KipI
MSLLITRSGLLDTIQDGGRYGYQHLGINTGGVMDTGAMRVANILTGNEPTEAVVEMHFPAAEIVFESTVLIALTGADFSAQ